MTKDTVTNASAGDDLHVLLAIGTPISAQTPHASRNGRRRELTTLVAIASTVRDITRPVAAATRSSPPLLISSYSVWL